MAIIRSTPGRHRQGSTSRTVQTQPPKPRKRGFFRRWWWVFVLTPVVGILGLIGTIWYVYAHTTIPEVPQEAQTTVVFDRSGQVIARLHSEINRIEIPVEQMPQHLREAVIAVEDRTFYQHGGVSPWAIARAAWADITSGELEQGGSTITQQYVKNVFTGSDKTFSRKIKEAILAVKIDREYTKDEILEAYLNTIYFGNGAYGVQAASLTYFGIPARQLDVPQAALLAGLIQRPSGYEPFNHPDAAEERRNLVLTLMARQGYLTDSQAVQFKAGPVEVSEKPQESIPYAYFVNHVSGILQAQFTYDLTFEGGLRVRTTLDRRMQNAAEHAVADHLSAAGDPSAAVVAIDPATGAIRAMVGGKDFNTAQVNLATGKGGSGRQAGSAFKPFTLAAAMEQRISPKSVWKGPAEIVIPDPRCNDQQGQPWEVHNYSDATAGTMDLYDATANSVNTIFAQLVTVVGPDAVVDAAHDMGIQSDLSPVCSITLGTQEVTPLEMARAYATLAARGVTHEAQSITSVKTDEGEVLHQWDTEGDEALGQNDADLVTAALQRVVQDGTGGAADIGRPVAGKTGTTQNYSDAWFCGYTPQLVTCVWVGYPEGQRPMHDIEGVENVTGGSIPALIWHDFMTVAMQNEPVEDFVTPSLEGYDKTPTGSVTPTPPPAPSPSPSPSPSLSPSPSPSPSPEPSPSPTPEPSPSPSESPPPPPTTEPPPSSEPPPSPSPSGSPTADPGGAPSRSDWPTWLLWRRFGSA